MGANRSTTSQNFCTGIENVNDPAGGTGNTRTCEDTGTLHRIIDFVATDKDMTATYRGDANGAYLADGAMSYFEADVTLTAEFQNAADAGSGTISGDVTNIVAAGKSIAGSIELQEHSFADVLLMQLSRARPSAWLMANPTAATGRASSSE